MKLYKFVVKTLLLLNFGRSTPNTSIGRDRSHLGAFPYTHWKLITENGWTTLWFRHRLQEFGTAWNHPRSRRAPGTTPVTRLVYSPQTQWRPSTRTIAETPWRISTQTMRYRLRRFTLCARRQYRSPILNRQRRASMIHCVTESLGWRASNLEQDFLLPMRRDFVSPMVMDGSGCGIAEDSVMPTTVLLNRTDGPAGVWCIEVECTIMAGMDLPCNVQRYVGKVIPLEVVPYVKGDVLTFQLDNSFHFSICLTQDFPISNAVHTPPGQHTHRSVPHPAPARDLTDRQIRLRGPPPQTPVQLCLVIQDVWYDIPHARITDLITFMSRRCRVVYEAHDLSQPLLTLLHLTICCTEKNATINIYLATDDSRQIADSTHTKQLVREVSHFSLTQVSLFWFSIFESYTSLVDTCGMGRQNSPSAETMICAVQSSVPFLVDMRRPGIDMRNICAVYSFLRRKMYTLLWVAPGHQNHKIDAPLVT